MADRAGPEPVRVALTLHIGTGKTGTSSIQKFLAANRERLLAAGHLYPRTPGKFRHVRVSLSMKTDQQLAGDFAWHRQKYSDPERMRRTFSRLLQREIEESGTDRLLLSDEGLYGAPDDAILRLRQYTDHLARDVRVVVYLRRQDDHLLSRYQQVVKVGQTQRLTEWAAGDMTRTYDYRTRLDFWERAMAPSTLVVRPFQRTRFPGGSLLRDFFDACDIHVPIDDLEPTRDQNESLDADSVEFLRLWNLYQQQTLGLLEAAIDNREVLAGLRTVSSGPKLTLRAPLLRDFMARWEESNRAVAQRYLGDPRGALFLTDHGRGSTTSDQRLDPDRLQELMVAVRLPQEARAPMRRLCERENRAE